MAQQRLPNNTQNDAISLLKTSFRRWGPLAIILGLILAGGGVALTMWLWEPVYDAKKYVTIIQNREYTDVVEGAKSKTEPKSLLAPIKNDVVLRELLANEDVQKRPEIDLQQLKKMVRFETGGDELFAIVCRDQSPTYAAVVADALTTEIVDYHRQQRDNKLDELQEILNKEIAKATKKVEGLNGDLEQLNADRILSNNQDKQPIDPDGTLLAEMRIRRFNKQLEGRYLSQEMGKQVKALEEIKLDVDDKVLLAEAEASAAIKTIDQMIQGLKNNRSELENLGGQHPKVVNLNRRIEQLQEKRNEEFDRQLLLAKQSRIAEQQEQIRKLIKEDEESIARIESEITDIDEQIDRLTNELRSKNKLDFKFQQILKDHERATNRLDSWIEKQDVLLSKDMSLYTITVYPGQTSIVPTEPVEQFPLKIVAIVVLAGLALPAAAAVAWEFRLRRISCPEQFKQQLSTELLGEVADLPVRSTRPAALGSKRITRQLRLYEESVDNLSAVLSHAAEEPPQLLAVTSAASNEGKTTLSTQLAISSARSNFGNVLIIDADLRSPSLHRLFDEPLDGGLVDVLSQTQTLAGAVKSTDIENLDVLTAGRLRSNPRRYFSDDRWEQLLEEARQEYEHVIVDTPPVLAASESMAISKQCDYTLICVLRDVSRSEAVKRAYDRLIAADVRVVGYAFGGVPQNEYASKYGSYGYNLS